MSKLDMDYNDTCPCCGNTLDYPTGIIDEFDDVVDIGEYCGVCGYSLEY